MRVCGVVLDVEAGRTRLHWPPLTAEITLAATRPPTLCSTAVGRGLQRADRGRHTSPRIADCWCLWRAAALSGLRMKSECLQPKLQGRAKLIVFMCKTKLRGQPHQRHWPKTSKQRFIRLLHDNSLQCAAPHSVPPASSSMIAHKFCAAQFSRMPPYPETASSGVLSVAEEPHG